MWKLIIVHCHNKLHINLKTINYKYEQLYFGSINMSTNFVTMIYIIYIYIYVCVCVGVCVCIMNMIVK